MKIALIHAYSSLNSGDGLLVDESLALARQAFGSDATIDLFASQPDSFGDGFAAIYKTIPGRFGYDRQYIKQIRKLDEYDFILAVGGGYLRGGTPMELAKMLLVHGPQLFFASRARTASVYLPQSIGPLRFGIRPLIRRYLRNIDYVVARDGRTVQELELKNVERRPDLAVSAATGLECRENDVEGLPILSVRAIRGKLPPLVRELANQLGEYDTYIQSRTRGNDDTSVTSELPAVREVERDELLRSKTARVVVAVRLHAALMAIQAGHFVIHLAYERKGFGAFDDFGIPEYVHNVNSFDPALVRYQVHSLQNSAIERKRYFESVQKVRMRSSFERTSIANMMRKLAQQDQGV
ncbi:hypothetical protein CH249_11620 [Rhodococcus sp. 05-2255-3B1]|uniref:polysaccharide pyruvyl transferase family protein n=1 Tax=unclassified Rhodococcus (in: high G+C Gram-positive bacteria) TaxID=192944 RepID=UPI000B9C72DF|nr:MULTISPECIES: polysaccharide pyruvyl transferase family protein [unclassified Rhodococcus (in: high G+C Gram-positive bacteria)]OZE02533.1 hypothetical protein CH250_25140 [Rhodococcus sp. 05-2255-3C]OZE11401.1 hypothetical protein CH249_11620 [Rhodococcus sp. 05-2255-3B1]OZE13127.1 hypothetical protein CH255_25040 [Rhodococcus sp. 05-2255-2A2]